MHSLWPAGESADTVCALVLTDDPVRNAFSAGVSPLPAIDPERLEREIGLISGVFDQPDELRRKVLDLLDFYADRAKRPGAATHADDVPWDFGIPKPVQRALAKALSVCGVRRPDAALTAAESLWQAAYRETRLLALAILSGQTRPEVADWIEVHILEAQDSRVLKEAAGVGLEGWRLADPPALVQRALGWTRGAETSLQTLGLMALAAAVDDPRFEQLPSLMRGLAGLGPAPRGDSRRALGDLVNSLARRTPPEAARFLLDEIDRRSPGIDRLVRGSLDMFPPAQRQQLSRALSR